MSQLPRYALDPDEHHVALPKLYGAPAYARPPRVYDTADRPVDPDDLPLEAFREDDESLIPEAARPTMEWVVSQHNTLAGPERSTSPVIGARSEGPDDPAPMLRARPFSVRTLGRFIGRR